MQTLFQKAKWMMHRRERKNRAHFYLLQFVQFVSWFVCLRMWAFSAGEKKRNDAFDVKILNSQCLRITSFCFKYSDACIKLKWELSTMDKNSALFDIQRTTSSLYQLRMTWKYRTLSICRFDDKHHSIETGANLQIRKIHYTIFIGMGFPPYPIWLLTFKREIM